MNVSLKSNMYRITSTKWFNQFRNLLWCLFYRSLCVSLNTHWFLLVFITASSFYLHIFFFRFCYILIAWISCLFCFHDDVVVVVATVLRYFFRNNRSVLYFCSHSVEQISEWERIKSKPVNIIKRIACFFLMFYTLTNCYATHDHIRNSTHSFTKCVNLHYHCS